MNEPEPSVKIETSGTSSTLGVSQPDRILRNRWVSVPLFVVVMFGVYYFSVVWPGGVMTRWVSGTLFGEWLTPAVRQGLEGAHVSDWVVSLIVHGGLGGVGAVFGFIPQMAILFLMLSFLEECGYMARVALALDRFFHGFGLSGRSVVPMLLSSGCGVPGIMATESIENDAERRLTVMTTAMIPCSAKLPVIGLVAGSLSHNGWWMAPAVYFAGIAAVAVSCTILRKFRRFAGPAPSHRDRPLKIRLPRWRTPRMRELLWSVWDRCRTFVIKAGVVIFFACAIIWCLSSTGWNESGSFGLVGEERSLLAWCGKRMAWIFEPIGFGNWKAVVATITGLVGKENIVGTLAVLNGLSHSQPVSVDLWRSVSTIFDGSAGAIAFLIFNLFCAPCVAAVAAIHREMRGWRWTLLAIGFQTGFAWCVALMIHHFGRLAMGTPSPMGVTAAIGILIVFLYLILRPGYREPEPCVIPIEERDETTCDAAKNATVRCTGHCHSCNYRKDNHRKDTPLQ